MQKAVSVLIKPSSSLCNMRCKYCFYADVSANREEKSYGLMTRDTAKEIIKRVCEYASKSCSFMFQGGEPTLAGLDFYRSFIQDEKEIAPKTIKFSHAIQTNGYLIDDEWAKFFKENDFLIGLSLDGTADVHNENRIDSNMNGTWSKVMRAANILKKYGVAFNILSVITNKNARSIRKTYNFFKKNDFKYLQFIPCIDPFDCKKEISFSLNEKNHEQFLESALEIWNNDMRNGQYVSVRHIDNLMSILQGKSPEICSMNGRCSIQFVVEGDGSVYPCDFYVLDEWRLGNVKHDTFDKMISCDTAQKFIKGSTRVPDECKGCNVYTLCRNGCRRDRVINSDGTIGVNRHCSAYKGYYNMVLNSVNRG